ncbi:MAG: sugar kinase [Sphingobacteriales bacterium 50-39]|nr:ROK family protein [Sphingobacteriales bacterium]OJW54492.1 MAG: sugar kinase [Sphingobacteriales bacterium 50-39]
MIARPTIPFTTQLKYRLISQLYFFGTASCNDLSESLGKSVPHVTKSLYELIDADYIVEKGYAPSNGGRPPLIYALQPDRMYILSVSIDQLYTRIGLLDMSNQFIFPIETIELRLLNNKDALAILTKTLTRILGRMGKDRKKIIGGGFSMPGFVNTRMGINFTYLSTNSKESLRDYLERHLHMPVYIENDSSVLALAELKAGMAQNLQDVMVIDIGWGIGLGMIVKGELFRGHTGYAGELSHIPISESNTLCECGKRGCLETEATLRVVAHRAMEEIKAGRISSLKIVDSPEKMSEAIMAAANQGDQYAIGLLTEMGFKIGKAIAILIHIVNPELIILGGRGAEVGKILIAPIQQALNQYCIPRLAEDTRVKVSQLGHDASLLAAAALVMEKFGQTAL